jgi:hypothetical protein
MELNGKMYDSPYEQTLLNDRSRVITNGSADSIRSSQRAIPTRSPLKIETGNPVRSSSSVQFNPDDDDDDEDISIHRVANEEAKLWACPY